MITANALERSGDRNICASIGIIAWNEEEAIQATLESLWQQSLFAQLRRRGLRAEIICVANGCTDRTAELARLFFEKIKDEPLRAAVSCRVVELSERGKNNAWKVYVPSFSAANAARLILMVADIVSHVDET